MYLLIIHDPSADPNKSVSLPLFPTEVPCLEIENLFRTSKTGFCDKRIKRNVNKMTKDCELLAEVSSISYSNDSEKKMHVQSHTDHTDQGVLSSNPLLGWRKYVGYMHNLFHIIGVLHSCKK